MRLVVTRNSMIYIEWDGLVSYLEHWTSTFKVDTSLKEIDEVVSTVIVGEVVSVFIPSTGLLESLLTLILCKAI